MSKMSLTILFLCLAEKNIRRVKINHLEVRAGIEPAYTDLQSAASPLCHRTNGAMNGYITAAARLVKRAYGRCHLRLLSKSPRHRYKAAQLARRG